jgi:hypothetical protein
MGLKIVLQIILLVLFAWHAKRTWGKSYKLQPGMSPAELDKLRRDIFIDHGAWAAIVFLAIFIGNFL